MRNAWLGSVLLLFMACSGSGSDSSDALAAANVEGARRGGGKGATGGLGDGGPSSGDTGASHEDGARADGPDAPSGPKLDALVAADTFVPPDATIPADAPSTPDAAPTIPCQTSCADLQTKYTDAVKRAKVCTVAGGCGVAVNSALVCGCTTWVTNDRELVPLRQKWDELGCAKCGPICSPCLIRPTRGNCSTKQEPGPGPVPVTTTAVAPGGGDLINPPRIGTCMDGPLLVAP
jgi:hypothetical protein